MEVVLLNQIFEKADEFNGQFTDVFTKTVHTQVPLLDRSAPSMDEIVVTKEGVTKLLKGLNPSKALGPDELHPRVLKELAKELGLVFAHLFQQSINTGEIPKEWSLANICPLFKKGDRSLACNYRPVSLTCIPCKRLERIVCSSIMSHIDQYNLLSDKQHAFRKWHSCETQLITVIIYLLFIRNFSTHIYIQTVQYIFIHTYNSILMYIYKHQRIGW